MLGTAVTRWICLLAGAGGDWEETEGERRRAGLSLRSAWLRGKLRHGGDVPQSLGSCCREEIFSPTWLGQFASIPKITEGGERWFGCWFYFVGFGCLAVEMPTPFPEPGQQLGAVAMGERAGLGGQHGGGPAATGSSPGAGASRVGSPAPPTAAWPPSPLPPGPRNQFSRLPSPSLAEHSAPRAVTQHELFHR